uniref:Uncharacterized protein n=1 Tax=Ditylenchus dipsaci TaxID=166011 RepID=A0A915DEV2_9BILA
MMKTDPDMAPLSAVNQSLALLNDAEKRLTQEVDEWIAGILQPSKAMGRCKPRPDEQSRMGKKYDECF